MSNYFENWNFKSNVASKSESNFDHFQNQIRLSKHCFAVAQRLSDPYFESNKAHFCELLAKKIDIYIYT